jgi:lysozyme family protein
MARKAPTPSPPLPQVDFDALPHSVQYVCPDTAIAFGPRVMALQQPPH